VSPPRFRPDPAPEHDRIEIVAHDPEWERYFALAADLLRELLGPHIGRVEHVGSTAVPGLAAKPVIDMLVEVPSAATASSIVMPRLVTGGLEAYWQPDGGAEHWFFIQRHPVRPRRTHHVHVAPAGHPAWDMVLFRDHLRSHPEVAAAYVALKRRLAARYPYDREAYTAAKSGFVAGALRAAR
jgi:GrpB-like predicted nucleotidyltransferase (UPF0157 family)